MSPFRAMPEPHDEQRARARAIAAAEVANAPVLVLAYSVPGRDEHETRENYAAVACALQNMQLAAVEEGLVSGWSTGGFVRDPAVRRRSAPKTAGTSSAACTSAIRAR